MIWLGREKKIRWEETGAQPFLQSEYFIEVRSGCDWPFCRSDLSAFTPVSGSETLSIRPLRTWAILIANFLLTHEQAS